MLAYSEDRALRVRLVTWPVLVVLVLVVLWAGWILVTNDDLDAFAALLYGVPAALMATVAMATLRALRVDSPWARVLAPFNAAPCLLVWFADPTASFGVVALILGAGILLLTLLPDPQGTAR